MNTSEHSRFVRAMRGLSALETLIVLAVIALILMVSMPGVNSMAQKYHLRKATNNLLDSLNLAQHEAARRGSIGRLCPSSDGNSCRADGDWNRGWVVFLDSNANQEPEPVEILAVYGPPSEKVRINASGNFESSAVFNINGIPTEDGRPKTGKFRLCFGNQLPGFEEILIDEGGRPEVRKSEEDCLKT